MQKLQPEVAGSLNSARKLNDTSEDELYSNAWQAPGRS
jgi:hypothetical protein